MSTGGGVFSISSENQNPNNPIPSPNVNKQKHPILFLNFDTPYYYRNLSLTSYLKEKKIKLKFSVVGLLLLSIAVVASYRDNRFYKI